jgi:hypothetical protein
LRRSRGWFFFAVFVLAVVALFVQPYADNLNRWGPELVWRSLYKTTMYSRVVIFVNYFDDGFVRRGLGGTIAALISRDGERGILGYLLFSIAFLTIPLGLSGRAAGGSAAAAQRHLSGRRARAFTADVPGLVPRSRAD